MASNDADSGALEGPPRLGEMRPETEPATPLVTATRAATFNCAEPARRTPIHQTSLPAPTYQSPYRHHHREPSVHHEVKETLDARSGYRSSEDDGVYQRHINQYFIGEEIGRGSFGAVHVAIDQYGQKYAVKEFSKSRLRRRIKSNFFRRPLSARHPGQLAAGRGFTPIHKQPEECGSLHLIKEEIAIMKKLNHPNLVRLVEVLDDPEEDSLYMVLELCQKGVVMKVGVGDRADPYDSETCRYWFRDMILGIEYLHAQGIAHRDIKPDNLLITSDDVLKVSDFGVSEMFEKDPDMMTAKSAGSPAFLPPELCVVRHGDVSGRAADIWSMGVSLYCLRFGRIPFEHNGVLEMYEAIKNEDVDCTPADDPKFCDLMHRILEKDPSKRITMTELRDHPWVTNNGTDPLLSKADNVASLVEPPTQQELNHAITTNIGNLMLVVKAVNKFKRLLGKKHPDRIRSLFDDEDRSGKPTGLGKVAEEDDQEVSRLGRTKSRREGHFDCVGRSKSTKERLPTPADAASVTVVDGTIRATGGQQPVAADERNGIAEIPSRQASGGVVGALGEKGHAHDVVDFQAPWLGIGVGHSNDEDELTLVDRSADIIIAESPSAAEFNIYDTAYREEVERIRKLQGDDRRVYLTRRIEHEHEPSGIPVPPTSSEWRS